jgi:hypothetical protein
MDELDTRKKSVKLTLSPSWCVFSQFIENDDVIEAPVIPAKKQWDDEDADSDDIKVSFYSPTVSLTTVI